MAIRTYGPQRGRLGAADRFRPAPHRAAGAAAGRAGALGARGAAGLRLRQHPLHDLDAHRHLGDGQADPLRAAAPATGSRSCGTSARPPSTTSCTTRGWTTPGADADRTRHRGRRGPARSGARAGISTLRGAFHPDAGIAEEVARKVGASCERFGVANEPLGVDVIEMPILFACSRGHPRRRRQQVFLEARRIKTGERSGCSPRRRRWSTRRTTSCTRSCVPACGRTRRRPGHAREDEPQVPGPFGQRHQELIPPSR